MTLSGTTKWTLISLGIAVILTGYWALYTLRISLNASASLPHNAYVLWTWPKRVTYGTIISVPSPPAFEDTFEGLHFTKEVYGLPGDVISHAPDGRVCVNGECFALYEIDGEVFAPALPEGIIPEGRYAAFGQAGDSLDSRYEIIGLFAHENIYAVGFGTDRIPHWTAIRDWSQGRAK